MKRATELPPEEAQHFTVVDEDGWCFRRPYPAASSKYDHKAVHCSIGNRLYLVVDWQDVSDPNYFWQVEWDIGDIVIVDGEVDSLERAKLLAEAEARHELERLVKELGGEVKWTGRMLDCTKESEA